MALDRIYRAQLDPGGSPAFGGASGEATGAAVGRGLQEAGATLDRRAELERQRERQASAASAGVRHAEITGAIDVFSQERRQGAAAGGAGHTTSVLEQFDKDRDAALGEITDDRVREIYAERYAETRSRILGREDGWERGAHVEQRLNDFDQAATLLANQQATNPSPEGLAEALGAIETQAGLVIESEDLRDRAVREQSRKVVSGWANAMVDRDHAALLAVLEAGALNAYLEPEDLERLRNGVHVEARRQEAEARRVAAEQEATTREEISLFRKRIAAGAMPDDAEFDAIEEKARATGDATLLFDVQVDRSQVLVNRETRDWTPAMFEQAIAGLREKGDKRSDAEDIRLAQLEAIAGPRTAEFNEDPHAWSAQRGSAAPPLDLAAPTTEAVDRRVAWARGQRRAAGLGYTPYLSEAELEPLKDRLGTGGAAGLVEVAGRLRGAFGAGVGGEIARQLAPGNRDLELLVGLKTSVATLYHRGADVLERKPKMLEDHRDDVLEIFDAIAPAIPAEFRTPVYRAAVRIAAASADGGGSDDLAEAFDVGLQAAMGGEIVGGKRVGGFGEWREAPVWLPPRMSQAEFDRKIARAPAQAFVNAGGSAAHYGKADGTVGAAVDWRVAEGFELETISPGVYRVRGPGGGLLVNSSGGVWQFDVRRLP